MSKTVKKDENENTTSGPSFHRHVVTEDTPFSPPVDGFMDFKK
jgi:hypothetical protein